MTPRPVAILACALGFATGAVAAAGDPLAGTWEARVASKAGTYTLRLACKSSSDCEMQLSDSSKAGKPEASTLPFKGARPMERGLEPVRKALRHALEHRADSKPNAEYAAIHTLLAASVDAKTELDRCIDLDSNETAYFVVCTVRGATTPRPMLLLFGRLLGPCGHGFCGYVVYPLARSGSRQ
jgi:hypothetical protein